MFSCNLFIKYFSLGIFVKPHNRVDYGISNEILYASKQKNCFPLKQMWIEQIVPISANNL
jgi:hypothetical protein